jgi:hypothetical protein
MAAVESTAADIGAAVAEVLAFRLDCVPPLPTLLSRAPGSSSRVSGTMSPGSNLRNSFFFSGESCVCAIAPEAESNNVNTTTGKVSCVLTCVSSFHCSHLKETNPNQREQRDKQERDRHSVDDEF